MIDLHTEYLGLSLRSPLVASAGPFTGDVDKLRELRDAGVAAVVLPSLFEEQIEHETAEIDRLYTMHQDSFGEATSFMPELDNYNTGTDTYLSLIEAARDILDVPVIASLNGANIGGWLRYARLLEDAGADAIELNLYTVAADPAIPGQDVEAEQLELVALLTDDVNIPVAVKISPFYTSVASFALGLKDAGASGIVLFNRFYAPDLDLEQLDVKPKISLSRPAELRLPLRWIGILREFLDISLAGSTGVHSGRDAVKLILAGADVTMMTSALLFNGASYVAQVEQELIEWMHHHDYRSVAEMRGAVSRDATADPSAYERANYIGNITSYSSRFIAGQPIRLQSR
ncbi:MAG: dihydroorotate dehydrogenase-like protein [Ilumatobacter sp.]|nr:dihydroorotate dehydrogenase-like protein [Ilumatobacter sp.]